MGSEVFCAFLDPFRRPFFPFLFGPGGSVFLPCPLEAARAADFDFSQWFARIVFPRYFLDLFNAMFEDLILPSNVPSVVASALFEVLFVRYISNDQDWEQVDDEDCWGVNYTEPTTQIREKIETILHIWGEEKTEPE